MTPISRPLWVRFLIFLLPMMATNILQALSGTLNNIFLGRMIGVHALAAASVFFPVMFLFIAFLIGLSAGASVLIGQAFGARKPEMVKAISGTVLTVAFLGGLAVAVLAGSFAGPIMRALGTPPDILADAVLFARLSFIAMPVMFLFFIGASLLRGVGDTMTPLLVQMLATGVTAVVTPALIRGWFGLPQLGIASAAVGMGLSFLLSFIALGFYLRLRRHPMAPDRLLLRSLWPDWRLLLVVLRIGVPTAVQVIAGALAGIVIIGLVNRFGSTATAAYGAVHQVMSYVQFPALSIGITASIFGAQMIGAGQAHRLSEVLRIALLTNLALTGGLVAAAYLGAEALIGLFIDDPAVVAQAEGLLYIVAWSALMFGAAMILSGIMRAAGTVLVPMLLALVAIIGLEVPVAVILSRLLGLSGIWWGYVAGFGGMMVLQAAFYWFYWRRKAITALV